MVLRNDLPSLSPANSSPLTELEERTSETIVPLPSCLLVKTTPIFPAGTTTITRCSINRAVLLDRLTKAEDGDASLW
jgi:hypothetical protein